MNCSVNQSLNPAEFEVTQQTRQGSEIASMLGQNANEQQGSSSDPERSDHSVPVRTLRRSCRLSQRVNSDNLLPNLKRQCESSRLLFGTAQKLHQPGRVLACDTPEADYGLRVSIRRRKHLLPPAARSKLLS